jgi:multidrug efflux pump subunit AcrA (membrane-fusion protein)
VTRQTITAQTSMSGTLGFSGSYTVTGKGRGSVTWLPQAGHVVRDGWTLYKVDNGAPVVLLYGTVPAWRTLTEGMTGQDVAQLNADLVNLGYVTSSDVTAVGRDYFGWETKYGLEKLQSARGATSPSGVLQLGAAVFEPGAIRVTATTASLGGPASGPILTATSASQVVSVKLDTSLESEVKAGDKVSVALPDGIRTPGVVTSIGKVAATSSTGSTVPVTVKLTHPKTAGGLDQAPVTVYVTTSVARNALVVPVTALQAQSSGGYAVDVVTGSRHHLVPVTPGLFDSTGGLVQVTGPGLAAGQRVVVPGG